MNLYSVNASYIDDCDHRNPIHRTFNVVADCIELANASVINKLSSFRRVVLHSSEKIARIDLVVKVS